MVKKLLMVITLSFLSLNFGCIFYANVEDLPSYTNHPCKINMLDPGNILVDEEININKFKKMLVVVQNNCDGILKDIVLNQFSNLRFFDSVVTLKEFERNAIEAGIENVVSEGSKMNLDALKEYHRRIKSFLIADCNIVHKAGFDYRFEVRIIEPEEGITVLYIDHLATCDKGIDEQLLYPVFSTIRKWINHNRSRGWLDLFGLGH